MNDQIDHLKSSIDSLRKLRILQLRKLRAEYVRLNYQYVVRVECLYASCYEKFRIEHFDHKTSEYGFINKIDDYGISLCFENFGVHEICQEFYCLNSEAKERLIEMIKHYKLYLLEKSVNLVIKYHIYEIAIGKLVFTTEEDKEAINMLKYLI